MKKKKKSDSLLVDNVDEIIEKHAKGSGQWLIDRMDESKRNRKFILKSLRRLIAAMKKRRRKS